MKPPEPWNLLIEKAGQDEYTVDRLLDDPGSPDEVIGFHLQQAAEKLLKAALLALDVHFRRTHNLGELAHLLQEHGHRIPEDLDGLRELTPFATEWRYDLLPGEGEDSLDRLAAREKVAGLRVWVERLVESAIGTDD